MSSNQICQSPLIWQSDCITVAITIFCSSHRHLYIVGGIEIESALRNFKEKKSVETYVQNEYVR